MNFKLTAIHTLLLIGILTIVSSCHGQNASENRSNSTSQDESNTITLGKTVPEMLGGVTVIFQDQQNNYWFGGNDKGVYRYDGKNLVLFTKNDGLCSHSIAGIQEDKFGNIYFDTSTGVSKFDGQKFTTLSVIDSNSSNNEWSLEPDDLWFRLGTDNNGPHRYDGKSLYPLTFPKPDLVDEFYSKYPNASYNPYGIYTMYKDRKGRMWFGTASLGVCRYDGKSLSWLYEKQLTETPGGGDFGIRSIIEDQDGYFWFCNTRYRYEILPTSTVSNGTSRIDYNRKEGVFKSGNNAEDDISYFMSFAEDNKGDLWMVTYNDGVWRNNGKELIHYPIKDGDSDVLLFSIYKDNQGVLWIGTHEMGVYKFNGKKFEPFKA